MFPFTCETVCPLGVAFPHNSFCFQLMKNGSISYISLGLNCGLKTFSEFIYLCFQHLLSFCNIKDDKMLIVKFGLIYVQRQEYWFHHCNWRILVLCIYLLLCSPRVMISYRSTPKLHLHKNKGISSAPKSLPLLYHHVMDWSNANDVISLEPSTLPCRL